MKRAILAYTASRSSSGQGYLKELLMSLILLGATLFALLGIGEGAVRLIFRKITTTADNASYFARRWNMNHVRLNSLGFRDRELPSDKPEGSYHIAVIGDSFTFGQGIPEEERFTNLLERRLNEKERRYRVFNFGRPGAETVNELATLREIVLKIRPDFVLLQWYINDFEGEDKKGRPGKWPLIPVSRLHGWLHQHSAFYFLMNQQWSSLQEWLGSSGGYEMYMRRRFENPESVDSIAYRQTLNAFIDLCRERGIPVGMVLFPHLAAGEQGYPFDYLHDRVLEMCVERGISCVDLRSTFASYRGGRELWANRLDSHPGPLANRLAADRLIEAFGPLWRKGRVS